MGVHTAAPAPCTKLLLQASTQAAHRQHICGAAGSALALARRQQECAAPPALLLNKQRVERGTAQQAAARAQHLALQRCVGGARGEQEAPAGWEAVARYIVYRSGGTGKPYAQQESRSHDA